MIPRLLRLAPWSAAVLLSGCLEFAEQTMSWRHDAATDTLRLHLVYHGIFGGDQPDGLSATEREQLESVLRTERAFFFANWITEFNREEARQELARLRDPARAAERAVPPDALHAHAAFLEALIENVQVTNGPFYLDGQQRLCGVQHVTVRRVSRVIAAANAGAPHLWRALAAEEGRPAEERARLLAAAQRGGDFLRLEGNRFEVRWPMSRSEFEQHYGDGHRAGNGRKVADAFRRTGGNVTFADDMVTWSFGRKTDRFTSLTLPVSEKAYRPNALTEVRQRAIVRERFDADAAAREFLLPSR